MPPLIYPGEPPPSTSLTPTSDNRGIPQRKALTCHSPPQSNYTKNLNGASIHARQIRPLTVNEALQYSSLSSIVPFDTSIIPLPNVDLPVSTPIFATPPELQQARQSIERLDQSLSQTRGNSRAAQQALQDIRSLLEPQNIIEYQFKVPHALRTEIPKPQLSTMANGRPGNPSKLGAFANMVLDATDVAFRYPTPSSPDSKAPESFSSPKLFPSKLPITPKTPKYYSQNNLSVSKNAALSNSNAISLKSQQPKLQPSVVIPPLPPSSDPSQYKVFPAENSGQASKPAASKKRKRGETDGQEATTETKDQRAICDANLAALQDLVSDILEAENDFQSGVENTDSLNGNAYFMTMEGTNGLAVTLTPATNTKLESCLVKVITSGRFGEVPVEHLSKIQNLCEAALTSAEALDIGVLVDWSEDKIASWHEKVEGVDVSLRSARTILRTMSGGREEKQIYSEELLQKVFDLLSKVMDTCIIPVVECRTSESQSGIFDTASSQKKLILQLLQNAGKVMLLLLELLRKVDLAEGLITSVEFFVTRLMFVENAHAEKESVLGIHKFESFRRTAMSMIAEIFSRYPEQRRFILDEILISLQKLPVNRQQARQYKLDDGKNVQLVSALLMRLVHSSGTRSSIKSARKGKRILPDIDKHTLAESNVSEDEGSQSSHSGENSESESDASDLSSPGKRGLAGVVVSHHLINEARSLYDSAVSNAQYIVGFFVTRASTASKTGDQPHRLLLDMFVGDLVSVINFPDWPAAELLLRALVSKMDRIANSDKSTAPMKNMALEVLGVAGSAVSDVTAHARQLARTLETEDSTLSNELIQFMEDTLSGQLEDRALLSWNGPYRAVIEYLNGTNSDPQTIIAQGYYLTQWTKLLLWANSPTTNDPDVPRVHVDLATKLCKMVASGGWLRADDFESVSSTQYRLAYTLTILNMGFCRAFGQVLQTLLKSIRSDQITVRTRSLKSVTQMLEKDPTLLDRMPQVMRLIISCASDQSSMVRDSSLNLIGKCIILQPALEAAVLDTILALTSDSASGIRKRSMKLLKDIYLRNLDEKTRAEIADSLLQRVQDADDTVSELARQTFEEIWLAPFWSMSTEQEASVRSRIALKRQVALIIRTIQRSERTVPVLQLLLSQTLTTKSKDPAANSRACKIMVGAAFEGMVDPTEIPGSPLQRNILQMLTIFARSSPKLFTQQQLEHLQPYISNLSTADDLNLFRSVVVILRCVLPTLPAIQKDFLRQVQDDLLKNIAKLAKAELDEVVACLWTINGELGNIEKLVNLEIGVLNKLHKLRAIDFTDAKQQQELSRLRRIILLAGHFAKHCDFQPQCQRFGTALTWWAGDSVAECVIDSIRPFAEKYQPLTLRSVAFDSIGMICQAWPKNFNRAEIALTFQQVLKDDDPELQRIVLCSFRDFFAAQDHQVEVRTSSSERDPLANGKLGGSMTASDNDGAAALIAQGFLKDILHIALGSQDADALTATEVIASITRQGLVHPKECGPALVALETSTNPRIAEVAFQQHQNLHQQHESMFEREYMRAIHEAYFYQRDIVHNLSGFTPSPHKAKLHSMYEIIKTSKSKYQSKFLASFCAKVDFDVTKLDVSADPPTHLLYARFLTENLAFFDYGRVEDIMHTTACMERIVAGTGAGIAHAINTDVFKVKLEPITEISNGLDEVPWVASNIIEPEIDPVRLRQLTTASMILSVLWEVRTFLRRLYGISASQQRRETKAKNPKDLAKAPTKNNGITGEKLIESIARIARALDSRESSLAQCKDFAELLAIDNEVKVSAEADDDEEGRMQTPSVEDDGDSVVPQSAGSKNGKRKGSASLVGTPHKKKKGRPSLGGRRKSGKSVEEDEDSY